MTTPVQPQSAPAQPQPSVQPLYPLAFAADGSPLKVPPEAVAWRVRRGGGRPGRPRQVFNSETGRQLDVPLTSTIDDLIDSGCDPDRYRLEAIDHDGHVLLGATAVVEVPSAGDDEAEIALSSDAETIAHLRGIIAQLVTANSQTMQAMASAFGTVRPLHEPAPPIVVHQPSAAPPPPEPGMRPEQIMQLVTTFGPMLSQVLKGFATPSGGGFPMGGDGGVG